MGATLGEELINYTFALPLAILSAPLSVEINDLRGAANKLADAGLQATNNFINTGYNYLVQNISNITTTKKKTSKKHLHILSNFQSL